MGIFGRGSPQHPGDPSRLPRVSPDAVDRIMPELQRGRKIQAIKLLREATGLGLKDAKDVIDYIDAGGDPASVFDRQPQSLAQRAWELRSQGRPAAAVALVAQETGMTESEASRFVDALGESEKRPLRE